MGRWSRRRSTIAQGFRVMNDAWAVSFVVLWLVVLMLAFLLAGALREIGLLRLRVGDDPGALITDSGLERGTTAPDFEAVDPDSGSMVRFSDLPSVARALVFVSPSCVACRTLVPHLNEVMKTRGSEFDFAVVCSGDVEACASFARTNRLDALVLVDRTGDVQEKFAVTLTPFAYLLDHEGRVVIRGVANNWSQLDALLDQEGTLEAGRAWTVVE